MTTVGVGVGVGVEVGAVALLRRFPLRSAAGESPGSASLTDTGLGHDRRWELLDAAGEVVTARRSPALAALRAGAGPAGELLVDDDAGWAERLAGPGARVALAQRPHRDGAAVHLLAHGAADDPRAPVGCDPGERANVVLALDPALAAPGDERGWVGRRLRLGGAVVVLTRTPARCLGVYADVVVPGTVSVGDPVVLLDPS